MAGQKSLIAVQLHRDGYNKSWGFRLQGGVDHGQLLTVQRVFMQSPSEGILHRGDAVIRINEFDATRMLLQDAEQIINNTAATLRMEVQRTGTGTSTPTSPQPQAYQQGPPSFQRQNSQTYQQNLQFQQQEQQKHQKQDRQQQAWQNSPTLAMINQQGQGSQANARQGGPRWEQEQAQNDESGPGMRTLMAREKTKKTGVLEYAVPLPNLDKLSVTNQTYRSNQLITPGPKAKHYRPMGSYLGNMGGGQAYDSGFNTRSFSKGQPRPKSFYDQPVSPQGGSNSLSPFPNGYQRQNSSSPVPQQLMGGRQWPPAPQPESPPPAYSPAANQFQFNGQPNYQQQQQPRYQPQQNYQQQPQQQFNGQPNYQQQGPRQQASGQLPFQIPQTGQPGRKVVHSDYNSPAGLYSTQNAVDMFTGQTGLRPNQVSGKGVQLTDFTQSPTYQLLQAQAGQRGGTAWGHARSSSLVP